MAAQTPILIDRCVQCSQPASQVCGGCSNAPDIGDKITEETSYCSTECQSANWPTHETACKRLQTRKALYRAGNTLQEIFYIYREKLFDRPVDRIEVTGTLEERNMKMRIYETEWPQIVTNYDFIQPFPSSMCNSLEEKQALLTYLTCSDAIGSMHDLIEYMLAGKHREFFFIRPNQLTDGL
jgi:Fe-S-cluster containining protein